MAKAGAAGRVATLTSGVRPIVIHTFHGHVLDGYFSRPVAEAFVKIERALAARTDALIAVSPEIRDELLNLGIGRPDRWHVVPVGLDLRRHLEVSAPSGRLRSRLGLAEGVALVGVAGRLVPIKDLETLLVAMLHLPGAHLAILGDGELRARLERRAQELGISERTHFTGWWHDMPTALADVDVIALTSLNEGTPVAAIEAQACGKPVVATDVGGVRSVVVDGQTGFLVPVRSPEAVADRLGTLIGAPDMRARFGHEGRRRAAANFGSERLVRDIRDLYASLLEQRPTA
jgi:glycosyltransferase involved in cell wall biosynthesis